MTERLAAYLGGSRVGWFTAQRGGPIEFRFEEAWRDQAGRMELSLSMPKSQLVHRGEAPASFLWGLLPDNEAVLRRWGTMFQVSARNPLALLTHVGLDVAGAVQLSTTDEPELREEGALRLLTDDDVEHHLREQRADGAAWFFPDLEEAPPSGRFSLAGAQAKFALTRTQDGWALPTGRTASTHIFKPGVVGLDLSDLNEHLTLRAAAALGVNVARSEFLRFGEERAVVVERYDRVVNADGTVSRLHQEDFAQALGVHPAQKYQADGGPGFSTLSSLAWNSVPAARRARTLEQLFDAAAFNWIIGGTDAHAKNYSLLHSRRGVSLAPLYDLAGVLPYPTDFPHRKIKLAMSMAKRYRLWEVSRTDVLDTGGEVGVDDDWVEDRLDELLEGASDAFEFAATSVDEGGEVAAFAEALASAVERRVTTLRRGSGL